MMQKAGAGDHDCGGWKPGPLPPGTYNWGGVVPVGPSTFGGFYFADFKGDHVHVFADGWGEQRVLKPDQVAWYNNALGPAPQGPTDPAVCPGGG